jgi:hypothetical protein
VWIAASGDDAAPAKSFEEIRPARHRDAETMRFRALAIRSGQKIANLFKAAPHKAWNPIPVHVSQCLSTGRVDSEASRGRGDCEKNAKKASPHVRDMAPIAIRALETTPGQKTANLFKAAPHKAWNPIPVRVSQCLSTGCVDSQASRRRGDCEKSAKKASPRVRDAAPAAVRALQTAAGQKTANLFKAAPHKAWNPIPARVSQCLSTACVDSGEARRARAAAIGVWPRTASAAGQGRAQVRTPQPP